MGDVKEKSFQPKDAMRMKNESGEEDIHYSVLYEGLPPEYQLLTERKLGETPANKDKGLRTLKEFLNREGFSCTESVLLMVLRSCKYNIKKSESKLKRYLITRQIFVNRLCQMDEEKIKMILEDDIYAVLPYRDKHGRTVIYTKPNMRFDHYSVEDTETVTVCFVLYLLTFPMSTVCGVSYIADCKCDSILVFYPVVKSFKNTYIPHLLNMPMRYGRADILFENVLIRILHGALCFLLPKKLSDRCSLHGDSYQSLHKVYDPNILTKDLDGNLENIHKDIVTESFRKFLRNVREKGEI